MLSGMARIAIIGGGSIGEALLSGLLRAGRQVKDLVVVERVPERAKYLADTYSVLISSVSDAVENASFVVVAVKPADVESVMAQIARAVGDADSDTGEQVFVTVAAGITITYFESKLPAGTPVVRAMPNAAALVGAGRYCQKIVCASTSTVLGAPARSSRSANRAASIDSTRGPS